MQREYQKKLGHNAQLSDQKWFEKIISSRKCKLKTEEKNEIDTHRVENQRTVS